MISRRRAVSNIAASMLFSADAWAQTTTRRHLIGFLGAGTREGSGRFYNALPQGLNDLGYVEGRDYSVEARYANGNFERITSIAQELVRLSPQVLITSNTAGALAAKQATNSVPIVAAQLTDPVGLGLARTEARPGMNVTGILARVEGLPGKLAELARDLIPNLGKIGVLVNLSNPSNLAQRREADTAAEKLGVQLFAVEIRTIDEIEFAFQRFARERPAVVIVFQDGMFVAARRRISAFALASQVPTLFSAREHVEDGGLMSYGVSLVESYRRLAYFVDRILKGEKAADLPIEFTTKVELVINLATAKAIGVIVPPALIARADEVIE